MSLLNEKVIVEVEQIAAERTSAGLEDRGSTRHYLQGYVVAEQHNTLYVLTQAGRIHTFCRGVDNNGKEVWYNDDLGDGAELHFLLGRDHAKSNNFNLLYAEAKS